MKPCTILLISLPLLSAIITLIFISNDPLGTKITTSAFLVTVDILLITYFALENYGEDLEE